MTKQRKIGIIVFCLIITLLIVCFIILKILYSIETQKQKEILNYLEKYEQSSDIFYSDDKYIYLKDKVIEIDNIKDYKVKPLYVTKEYIFFADYRSNNNKINRIIYKSNHDFTNMEIIYSYEGGNVLHIYMPNENEILYSDINNEDYRYYIKEQKLVEYNGETFYDVMLKNDYYYCKKHKKRNGIGSIDYWFEIIDCKTGETKKIDKNIFESLIENEIAYYLNENIGIHYKQVMLIKDKIYLQCSSGSIITTYEYDYESETLIYLDWINVIDEECYETYIL